ncbi:GntR family transcriptional regulator [Sphaerisporangium krabiense]|uniref:GntR family transcriptional regulator/MocR family aminotransferase n=1 Tax=Sphaerisporangium krabiense TaxID=763782 RepID=A0A7W9DNS5_9ACTN|nr:PLP-dependent aminotransferase family protein [Sphaerisporangium krabiense]MBB5625731.1 GntR family transcriptional regulator/MocR family aminotransferase [Sphaerisporangium krabiense]GII62933.1 GntR family transcriptional regulator [Sphaerisporangium krabiense]
MSRFRATLGLDLYVEIDPAAGRRTGLEYALRAAIREGRLAPGSRLPSTRALAAEAGLSRNTVGAAYDQLIAEGYLTARRGSGTSVAGVGAGAPDAPGGADAAAAPAHDLRPGRPDVTAFPAAAWTRATRRVLNRVSPSAYGYGDPRGAPELRAALAGYLGRTRGVQATPERIVVTAGAVQALALLARVLGTAVAMEDPGLPFHREVVRRAGARVLPLPVDAHGARADLIGAEAGAVVVTPAHQYPTGVTLHPARRHALVEWARGGGLVIEDDYDGEFRYDRQPVGALQGMAPGHVAYLGTASKTLAPGLRLAWLVLPPHLVGPVVDAKLHADHHTETLGQLVLADLVTGHVYDRHVRACRLRYRRRRDLLVARLGPAAVHGVAAGLHALITPAHEDEAEALARCAAHGVAVEALGPHWHDAGPYEGRPHGVIAGYGTPPEHAYPTALDALAAALRP